MLLMLLHDTWKPFFHAANLTPSHVSSKRPVQESLFCWSLLNTYLDCHKEAPLRVTAERIFTLWPPANTIGCVYARARFARTPPLTEEKSTDADYSAFGEEDWAPRAPEQRVKTSAEDGETRRSRRIRRTCAFHCLEKFMFFLLSDAGRLTALCVRNSSPVT